MRTVPSGVSRWGTYLVEAGIYLMLAGLCISRAAMSIGMGLSMLGTLLQWDWTFFHTQFKLRSWLWGGALFGGANLIWALKSGPPAWESAIGDWIPFLLLFLGLGTLKPVGQDAWYRILRVFVGFVSFSAVLMVSWALIKATQDGNWSAEAFSYVSLTKPLGHHPTYFGMLVNLCLPALYALYYQPSKRKAPLWGYACLALGLGLFQLLLAARMQWVILGILLLGLGLRYVGRMNQSLLAMSLLLGLLGAFIAWQHPFVQHRVDDLRYENWQVTNMEEISWNGVAVRLYLWETSFERIMEHPWQGVGLGQGQAALQEAFATDGFPNTGMNAHNQYLHTALETGLPGVFLLIGWWAIPFFTLPKKRLWFFAPVALVILMSGLTEVILTRQWGLLTATLFMVLSLAHDPTDTDPAA